MSFSVDSTRLGERFVAPGGELTLRAPASWVPAPAETLAEAMRRLGGNPTAESDWPQLRALYREPSGMAALAISQYAGPCPRDRRDRLAALQEKRLRAQARAGEVKSGRFGLRGMEIVQIRVVQGDRVLFKLLVSRPPSPLFQLDYVLPHNEYMAQLRAVESSIGSLKGR